MPYDILEYYFDSTEKLNTDFYANLLASTGDLAFILHDWLFTEQIIMASLNMPIAIKFFNENLGDDSGYSDDGNCSSEYY